jgi:two-component system chemotaxis response regulator CheB
MAVRVLVVDDSAFMRSVLRRFLTEGGLEVAGVARDGDEAIAQVAALRPDVVTLDVEMPRRDGLETLRAIMAAQPTPVVMVSSLTTAHAAVTLEALAAGAVDFVAKPTGPDLEAVRAQLVRTVQAAARARLRPLAGGPVRRAVLGPGRAARGYGLVVIGCSTGGPQALRQVVPALPADLPAPVLVVQHMPAGFTAALAERLDREAALRVREAAHGDRLEAGQVLVAPGGRHLVVTAAGRVALHDEPPEHGVRPAVDVTLRSVARHAGGDAVVAILTGMGSDGAAGAGQVRRLGGYVLAEAEETCAVYGMPRAVWELGAADRQVPLPEMAAAIVAAQQRGRVVAG